MKLSYKTTILACFAGYIIQAAANNFAPLLFITFQNTYHIPLSKITLLVTINFCVPVIIDFLATQFVQRIGTRASVVLAHGLGFGGFLFMAFLPEMMDPFTGLVISAIIYGAGSGLTGVLLSPIIRSCPVGNKEKAMSLLHSFYCWGSVGVILLSTAYFGIVGIQHWRVLALLWAILPLINGLVFLKTPLAPLNSAEEKEVGLRDLCRSRSFWFFVAMIVCAGASEISVSQWASAFAEQTLHISKAAGDLAGPLSFAVLMGLGRVFFGKYGDRINLGNYMLASCILCIVAYLLIGAVPIPALSLVGCGLCGLSVGIMWPGTLSKASDALRTNSASLFALLALSGNLGCTIGPTVVGAVTDLAGGDLKLGILSAVVFPVVLTILLLFEKKKNKSI